MIATKADLKRLAQQIALDQAEARRAVDHRLDLIIHRLAQIEQYLGLRDHTKRPDHRWQYQQIAKDLNVPRPRKPRARGGTDTSDKSKDVA